MEYGSLEHQPIHYLYHSVNFTELCALYTLGTSSRPLLCNWAKHVRC
jgi:trehalose-6-phosphate synthase